MNNTINELALQSFQEMREQLASNLCRELGDNLPKVLMLEGINLMNGKRTPFFDVLLYGAFKEWARLN